MDEVEIVRDWGVFPSRAALASLAGRGAAALGAGLAAQLAALIAALFLFRPGEWEIFTIEDPLGVAGKLRYAWERVRESPGFVLDPWLAAWTGGSTLALGAAARAGRRAWLALHLGLCCWALVEEMEQRLFFAGAQRFDEIVTLWAWLTPALSLALAAPIALAIGRLWRRGR